MLIHLVLLIVNIPKLKKAFFYHLVILVIGSAFIKVSYAVHATSEKGKLSVLSYNVRVFNNYTHLRNEAYISSKKMIGWSVASEADVKCFQEFYNQDRSDIFNVHNQLINSEWPHFERVIVFTDRAKGEFGTAIYSRYPIVNSGQIEDENGNFLNTIFADITMGQDTIRIYNTHLESMAIDEENVVNTDKLVENYIDTGYRLRNGFMNRAVQIDALKSSIKSCPYKTILCGDLNEIPYSYTYFSLRSILNNAFEKAGNGFGFTYNGKLFFLRIDNQFFSRDMKAHNFFTFRNVNFSDHFPIMASYSW